MSATAPQQAGMRCPTLAELPAPPAGRAGWPWTEESRRLPDRMLGGRAWPLLSIVTPSYNQARYLEETIRSVLLQGYPNLEYIVMDGGSADGSVAILEQYAPWLAHWQSGRDGGQSDAIASGFERARGAILAWINSDDTYMPGAFGRVARFFAARPRMVFGNGDVDSIDGESRLVNPMLAVSPVPIVTASLGRHGWMQQGCFWRRDAYLKVGGVDRALRFCMDRDLFLRLTRAGPSARIPGLAIANFRLHEEAKTSTLVDVWQREDRLLRERYGSPLAGNPLYRGLLEIIWWARKSECIFRRRLNLIGIQV
jgi:glycosyltransferase involved in cell wall biosynthesis